MKFHLALNRCLDFWKKHGASRAQIAKEVGCSVASISHWANDRRPIEHHSAKALFQVLVKRLTGDAEQEALLDLAPRENRTFEGLVLNERLEREGVSAKCGIFVVNLNTGDIEHRVEIEGVVQEMYDVAVLPDTKRPKALGFRNDEIRFAVRPEEG